MSIKSILSSAVLWTMLTGSLAQAQSWPNNEPAGMTQITLVNGTSKVWPSPWQQVGANWNTSRVAVVADAGAKYGSAVEKRFLVGDVSGWNSGLQIYPNSLYKEVYTRIVFKVSSNWDYHSGSEKIFLCAENGRQGNNLYDRGGILFSLWHSNVPGTKRFIIPGSPQVTVGSPFGNGPFAKIVKNQYHTVEQWRRLQDPGQKNGQYRVWIDGVEYTRFSAYGSSDSGLLDFTVADLANMSYGGLEWQTNTGGSVTAISTGTEAPMYWGGQNDTKTVDDWIRVSEIYISGSGGTGGTPPAAPSGLSASAVSSSQINLSWTDNSSNETGFKIERKTGSTGTYSQIATTGANTTSYNNTGLSASTTYYYRVRSYNGSGNSAYSNEANAATSGGAGGGIAFRAAASANSGSSSVSSLAVPKPAGVVSGDFMLAVVSVGANTVASPPAGWTSVRAALLDGVRMHIFKKQAGGSEPASYTWTVSPVRKMAAGIVAFSGVNATTPIQVENGAAHTTTASATHTTPTIATTGSSTWLVSMFSDRTGTGSTWTPPSGTTERVDTRSTGTNAVSVSINTLGPVAAGNKSHTATASISSAEAVMEIIALQP